jgi:tRNA-specific 2-thiouridylase
VNIAIAMSGGIDSSVAAALLKKEGHNLIGVTMNLLPRVDGENNGNRVPEAAVKAKEVAARLGIPHHIIDLRDIFQEKVISDFCREYARGKTPNPCVRCNRYVKFAALMEKARELGADFIATGHYARIERDEATGRYLLKKGTDIVKDQSYFLCQLTQEQLSRAIFPIGGLTKDRVRQIADELNLAVADRPESQEICFIPDDDYGRFLKNRIPEAYQPGPIINEEGKTIGEHRGIPAFTVGQRRGLGIATTAPLYVTAIEPQRNAVVVGPKDKAHRCEVTANNINWIAPPPEHPVRVKARVRYRHPEADATLTPIGDDTVHVLFEEPQLAVTPGQTVAFYDGDTVIGGGTIKV